MSFFKSKNRWFHIQTAYNFETVPVTFLLIILSQLQVKDLFITTAAFRQVISRRNYMGKQLVLI